MTPKIAIIIFPGTNCDLETYRACIRAGMKPEIIRWNEEPKNLRGFDGYILPGGFSYEDRGRSGVIASKEPIMDIVRKEAENGKTVLGICNGAQILVESALIPELSPHELEISLTWNTRIKNNQLIGKGYLNDWIYMRTDAGKGRSAYNNFGKDIIMRVPIAHGEGRFTTKDKKVLETIIKNEQAVFRYCDAEGNIVEDYPVNPNGAMYNIAGTSNLQGNVLALMPHPERTIVGQPIFDSLSAYIKGDFSIKTPAVHSIKTSTTKEKPEKQNEKPHIEITVKQSITDNTERTIENTIKKTGYKDIQLVRKTYYAFTIENRHNLKSIAKKLIETGELLNLNKEIPTITIGKNQYGYDKEQGLYEKKNVTDQNTQSFYVTDHSNFEGVQLNKKLKHYFKDNEITGAIKGTLWTTKLKKKDQFTKLLETHIFHNPHAMKIVELI